MTDIEAIAIIDKICTLYNIDWPTLASIAVPLGIIANIKSPFGLKDIVYEQAERLLLDKRD